MPVGPACCFRWSQFVTAENSPVVPKPELVSDLVASVLCWICTAGRDCPGVIITPAPAGSIAPTLGQLRKCQPRLGQGQTPLGCAAPPRGCRGHTVYGRRRSFAMERVKCGEDRGQRGVQGSPSLQTVEWQDIALKTLL